MKLSQTSAAHEKELNIAAYGPGVFDATQYQFKTSGTERLKH